MNIQQLKALGLEKRWPRLAELLREVASFEEKSRKANVEVQQLQAELGSARERDLNLEAQAARAGEKVPEPEHEPEVQKKLERASRDAVVMQRALEAAQTDLGAFRAKHQAALYDDVVARGQEMAAKVAKAAQAALVEYGHYEDLYYVVRDLTPPPAPDENRPAERVTTVYGPRPLTTGSSGPARGHVEQTLQYLIGLAEGPAQSGEDAA
jgi:hypothetical protein